MRERSEGDAVGTVWAGLGWDGVGCGGDGVGCGRSGRSDLGDESEGEEMRVREKENEE